MQPKVIHTSQSKAIMRQMKVALSALFPIFFSLQLSAQAPTIQDCLGAIPICQQVYSESRVLAGDGNYPNEINPDISCTDVEDYSIWYTFTVNESGNFGFVLTPNFALDDYDWALFNITNAECGDIYDDEDLLVSCNAAGGTLFNPNACSGPTGATGASSYDIQGAGCFNSFPGLDDGFSPFNGLIPVTAGNTYVLMVSNWSASTSGYTIDFGISNVDIFDFEPPVLDELNLPVSCNDNSITFTFDENVDCTTISAANFSLTGPNGESYALSLSSGICDAGGEYHDAFSLSISPALADSGNYILQIISEPSDPVTDLCGNPLASSTHPFLLDTPGVPAIDLGGSQGICEGQSVVLDATTPGVAYLWQDGSTAPTFTATSPGTYSVTVANACGQASDAVTVNLIGGPPVVDLGQNATLCPGDELLLDATAEEAAYLWQDGSAGATYTVSSAGEYAVAVTNACGTDADTITVDFTPPLAVSLDPEYTACAGEVVGLDVSYPGATYLWQDGSTQPILQVSAGGTYSVTVANACESVPASTEVLYVSAPIVQLADDTTLCPAEQLLLDATAEGATYLWQDGSTGPGYTVSAAGTYSVTATNACGEGTDAVTVAYTPALSVDLAPEYSICEGSAIELDVSNPDAAYQWQDGATHPIFLVSESGAYSVTVSNDCETLTAGTTVSSLAPPLVDLGADTALCEGEQLLLQVDVPEGTYLWQDSSAAPSMMITSGGTYAVTATNACGQDEDAIQVSYIPRIDSVELGEARYLCGGPVVFDVTAHEFASYQWQDGTNLPRYEASRPGLYVVEVFSDCETVMDSVTLFECEYCNVYVPNAFSPNEDGRNDIFIPQSPCELTDYKFVIFDRWGNQLFQAESPKDGWDGRYKGKTMPPGVYAWALSYSVEANGQVEQRSTTGDIMLVR